MNGGLILTPTLYFISPYFGTYDFSSPAGCLAERCLTCLSRLSSIYQPSSPHCATRSATSLASSPDIYTFMSSSRPPLGSTHHTAGPMPPFAQLQTPTSDQFVLEDEPHYTQRRCIPSPSDPYRPTYPPTRDPPADGLAYLSDDLSLPPPRAPLAAHQHPGRHAPSPTSNLSVRIPKGHLAITPSFASPFADVPPPSPVLAWSPDERKAFSIMSAAGEKGWSEYGEKGNGALRERSDDGEAIFWNRISVSRTSPVPSLPVCYMPSQIRPIEKLTNERFYPSPTNPFLRRPWTLDRHPPVKERSAPVDLAAQTRRTSVGRPGVFLARSGRYRWGCGWTASLALCVIGRPKSFLRLLVALCASCRPFFFADQLYLPIWTLATTTLNSR